MFYDLQLGLCDKRLKQIEVPNTIKRLPRSLSDYAHWKGKSVRVGRLGCIVLRLDFNILQLLCTKVLSSRNSGSLRTGSMAFEAIMQQNLD